MRVMGGEFPNVCSIVLELQTHHEQHLFFLIYYVYITYWLSFNFTVKHYAFQMKADTNSSIGPWEGKSNSTCRTF